MRFIAKTFTQKSPEVWYFKAAREIATGVVKIYPLNSCRKEINAFKRRSRHGTIEARCVFSSKEEAEEAYALEKFYAEMTWLTPEQQREALRALLTRLHKEYGVSVRGAAELAGIGYSKLRSYSSALREGAPLAIVKLDRLLRLLEGVKKEMAELLPEGPATGCGRKGRRGRPDIWKEAVAYQKAKREQKGETENERKED